MEKLTWSSAFYIHLKQHFLACTKESEIETFIQILDFMTRDTSWIYRNPESHILATCTRYKAAKLLLDDSINLSKKAHIKNSYILIDLLKEEYEFYLKQRVSTHTKLPPKTIIIIINYI